MSEERFTYRFIRGNRAQEIHGPSAEDLLRRASDHLQWGRALPVHIRQGRRVVYDEHDITDAWENRYL